TAACLGRRPPSAAPARECAPARTHRRARQPARAAPLRRPAAAGGAASQGLLAPRLEIGLDRPYGLLVERAFERRHVDRAVARASAAHGAGEVLVDLLHAGGLLLLVLQARAFVVEPAQVGRDAAGDGLQPVAARAVLVVGGGADLDGRVVLAVGVLGAPLLAERWQLA